MNRTKLLLLPLALITTQPASAAPGDMSVATFLAKADGLRAKGAGALFSSDIGVLRREGTAAGMAYQARLRRERTAGQPSSCPPRNAKVSSDRVITHMRSYPDAQRGQVTVTQAIADMFIRTWPCPA